MHSSKITNGHNIATPLRSNTLYYLALIACEIIATKDIAAQRVSCLRSEFPQLVIIDSIV